MRRIVLTLLLLFTLVSCEKIIEFDTSISQSEMVLNAVPSAEKQLFVNFSYTRFFLDSTNHHPINGADMVVSINGTDYRPTRTHRCNYFFDYTLHEEDSLAIRIKAGNHTVTSHTTVPLMPRISQPLAITNDSGAFHLLIINFNINDHPNYKDYYCISLRQRDSGCRYSPYFDRYDTIDTTYN
ncbi:MAG: DUF4249 family protein, partial [Bacteroidales bacterium]|nr:DUF4249 family protein [Bacteroidales bacterium]